MYLVDTPILVELGKARSGRTDPGLAIWAAGVSRQDLFISVIALLELQGNAARLGRQDKAAARAMSAWIDEQVRHTFEGRILPVDADVARRRAQLGLADSRDALMAATALERGMTLVTRNTDAFKAARVRLLDPWGYRAEDEDADWREAARTGSLWLRNLFMRT